MRTKANGRKSELDQLYTRPTVASMCVDILLKHINHQEEVVFIEPSAGNGSFMRFLPDPKIGMDIDPKTSRILKQDFFTWMPKQFANYITVGNPPFGVQCNTAIQFINHAAKFSKMIAFILPKSFKKNSLYKKVHKNFHYVEIVDLPKDSFALNDRYYDVPCSFFIMEYQKELRKEKTILQCDLFSFVKKDEADCRIQRVGGKTGNCDTKLDVSPQSNYFIKVNIDKISVEDFIQKINEIDFECKDWSVGPRSISRAEIVEKFLEL